MTPSTTRILRVWLPSAVWLAVIAVESTNLGSAEHTGRILYPIFHFVFDMDPARFAVWHGSLRKTGHIVGYFTLSVLLFRSLRATFPRLRTRWCLQWATVAMLNTCLVAMLDEWHQSFLPSRYWWVERMKKVWVALVFVCGVFAGQVFAQQQKGHGSADWRKVADLFMADLVANRIDKAVSFLPNCSSSDTYLQLERNFRMSRIHPHFTVRGWLT